MLEFGIDISVSKKDERTKPIPIKDIVNQEPAKIPSWAYGTNIYFTPKYKPVIGPVEL